MTNDRINEPLKVPSIRNKGCLRPILFCALGNNVFLCILCKGILSSTSKQAMSYFVLLIPAPINRLLPGLRTLGFKLLLLTFSCHIILRQFNDHKKRTRSVFLFVFPYRWHGLSPNHLRTLSSGYACPLG